MTSRDHDHDDDEARPKVVQQFFEFDCPECNANNPWADGFRAKDEIMCHYCGSSFEVRISDEGKLKLKAI